ncbi:hypothetical protein GCK72_012331 [Caenorhabditis remanei]|uniref:Uncharacterized protein n=1 Tax=Caenorhabditis remanei TaxID=31234 RepID=A0A6A5GKN6_CAERE|nr:hypothetical protein GCK72_012331 [Caenorhabditis remanei]KAF1755878.1 hypothetical protein GCK72_012331 [Caenorhabditis remanei]
MLPDPSPAIVPPRVSELRLESYAPLTPEALAPPAKTILEVLQTPRRPIKPLNGKQMIKMDEERENRAPYSVPSKRKGCNPKQALLVGKHLSHVKGIHFCARCRENVSIDVNRLMTVQLCNNCKVCIAK